MFTLKKSRNGWFVKKTNNSEGGLVMRFVFVTVSAFLVAVARGQDEASFEQDIAGVLSNSTLLTSEEVTNRIWQAYNATNDELRLSAAIAKSAVEYQLYATTADRSWADASVRTLTNAIVCCAALSNDCRFAVCKVLSAGNSASLRRYMEAYQISTNVINDIASGRNVEVTNEFLVAVFRHYKLDGLDVLTASRYIAGMSAAEMGWASVASNFANQVSSPYRQEIYEFLEP